MVPVGRADDAGHRDLLGADELSAFGGRAEDGLESAGRAMPVMGS